MGGLLTELGKKLADRWLSLLVLPGLLYLGALIVAHTLGWTHSFDAVRITSQINHWTTSSAVRTASELVTILIVALLGAAGVGLAAQALGTFIEWFWLSESQTRIGTRVRIAVVDSVTVRADSPRTEAPPSVNAVRATWMGNQIQAAINRLHREYRLDLATIWPYLWLSMPDATRAEVTLARDAFTRAATLFAWGLLYIAVGVMWWPGLVIVVLVALTGWRRARSAVAGYALLVEAAARLYSADLARALGMDHAGPLNAQTGWALTCLLQGKSNLIPLTTGWPSSMPPPTN